MGRVPLPENHTYQVKNTFVELAPADQPHDQFARNQRTVSDTCASVPRSDQSPQYCIPQTPSPFMSAQPDPCYMPVAYPMMDHGHMGCENILPACAFGDFAPEDGIVPAFNIIEAPSNLFYDPNTGTYMYFDNGFVPYGNCFSMVEGQMPEDGIGEAPQIMMQGCDKLGDDQIQVCGDINLDSNLNGGMGNNGEDTANQGQMENWDGAGDECWDGSSWAHNNYNSNYEDKPSRRKAERRAEREAARRSAAAISAEGYGGNGSEDSRTGNGAWGNEAQQKGGNSNNHNGGITTVMFRNIPNKYTREMLVNQLEQDMTGQFDFIYLPIDFKNKCNVGYAFINFRTVEACETFVNRFNGMEVRKCLPGLNSRKVTEVTPARVQGFEDNVQRLRNSPVMRELRDKPEWMPLTFDANGKETPFPAPEYPLEPIKPRRRMRDDEGRF